MAIPEIDVVELAERLSAGTPLVDVRQPDEYDEAHVPGAVLIPLDQLPERVAEVPNPVLLICRSGARSMKAAELLAAQGFDTTNVAGGTLAWIADGRATVSGSAPR